MPGGVLGITAVHAARLTAASGAMTPSDAKRNTPGNKRVEAW